MYPAIALLFNLSLKTFATLTVMNDAVEVPNTKVTDSHHNALQVTKPRLIFIAKCKRVEEVAHETYNFK